METTIHLESEKDLWKAKCLQFAEALFDIMDGMPDHEIESETGLPKEDCDRIAKARSNARNLLFGGK